MNRGAPVSRALVSPKKSPVCGERTGLVTVGKNSGVEPPMWIVSLELGTDSGFFGLNGVPDFDNRHC
jgi:hypothetical protein